MASNKAVCNDLNSENYYELLEKCSILDIGKIIKEIRKKNDITQDELAQRVGTKRAYISRIEKDASNVRLSTIVKILENGLSARINVSVES